MSALSFTLEPVPPFRLDLTAWALRRRPENIVDRWDGEAWRRVFVIEGKAVEVEVVQQGSAARPRLLVRLTGPRITPANRKAAAATITATLGLRVGLGGFYEMARGDRRLEPLVARFRGLKPPRFPSIFETLANAILCQQVSLASCMHLLARIARAYGERAGGDPDARGFPRPATIARLLPRSLQALGTTGAKARSLVAVARACAEGAVDSEALADRGDEEAIAELDLLPGIGRWSAQYALLRGLGRLNVFPSADAGGRRSLRRMFALTEPPDLDEEERIVRRWHPYAGFVYMHFLLAGLADKGLLT